MKTILSGARRTLPVLLALAIAASALPEGAMADNTSYGFGDVDIFLGNSGGVANAANVMILVDNSANWSRNAQGWTDLKTGATINQGQAEAEAIQSVIQSLESQGQDINIGLALLSPYNLGGSTGGGYIRFAARNMAYKATVNGAAAYPNATALNNILTHLYNYTNGGGAQNEQCCGMSHKDETAAFYEIYKYFSGLTPYTGISSQNPWVDRTGNLTGLGLTAADQGMTSGFALLTAGGNYQSPISSSAPCANNFIIYIANNSNGQVGSTENVYQSNVVPVLAALPATTTLKNGDTWLDEWTRFLYQSGAVVPAGNNNGSIVTYVLDAYNAQNDAGYSASLKAAAIQGGGRYYQVGSTQAVYNSIINVIAQIQALNSTFASASLPVNATNRAQNENQVFIPMFRPDAKDQPRWAGNLKKYQLVDLDGSIALGDVTGAAAVNTNTGFPMPCALSFWTTDSTDSTNYPNGYWSYGESTNSAGYWNTTVESSFAKTACPTPSFGVYTDDEDGPIVEKGGVAEVIRKGDNPPSTNSTPTWSPAARDLLTLQGLSGTTLIAFNQTNTGLPASLVSWVQGYDVQDENGNAKTTTESRPSVHGDEIHSRPLPIDYGSGAITVFYGSNDGTLRAVDASTGKEEWAFIAPEFYTPTPALYPPSGSSTTPPTGLERLMWSAMSDANGNQLSPLIQYFGMNTGSITPKPVPKDYYFDGSIGVYEGASSSSGAPSAAWIYPTMRRGGRMIYALDVTTPSSPTFLWKFGCPSLTSDTGCGVVSVTSGATAADAAQIGETWSTPAVASSVLGYSNPVVIVGAGYAAEVNTTGLPCEDINSSSPSCTGEKGAGIFVLDAQTGRELKFFSTSIPAIAGTGRAVAGDVSLISVATPGVVDHAYAADTGGNVYRIDFDSSVSNWKIHVVAQTTGAGRKFLFAPALLAAPGNQVYVALGSGDREHPLAAEYPYTQATQSTPVNQRFYVFRDSLAVPGSSADSPLNLDGSAMQNFTSPTSCSTPGVLPTSTQSGWFMDLNQNGAGEQTVTSALIAAGMVTFSTNRPAPPASTVGMCSPLLGYANGYWVNLFNAAGGISASGASCGGTRSVPFVGGGLPPSPSMATVPVGDSITQIIIGAAQLSGGASTAISPQSIGPAIIPKRKLIYWKSSGTD
jgi:type IV pilus assembly protein PilY1